MTYSVRCKRLQGACSETGYTLIELMIAVAVLMIVSASVFNGVQQLTQVSATVHNRSEMHAGVRNATELLQQEIGQAGRIALPQAVWLTAPVVGDPTGVAVQPVAVNDVTGLFVGEQVLVDAGLSQETVEITAIAGLIISGVFVNDHLVNTPVDVQGGFTSGVVPTAASGTVNGSTDTVLKIFGDINSDGNMVYVEYTCDALVTNNLYRNSMPFTAGVKNPPTVAQVLLNNVQPNPDGAACFIYQQVSVSGTTYVTDVAVTLTVQTERRDPVTGLFQMETKALLNVSPRNVFQVWQMASLNINSRLQPMPASVTALLP